MPTHILQRILHSRLILGVGLLLFPMSAAAQTFNSSMQENIASIVSIMIAWLNMLTWVAFFFLNILLDPSVIFDGPGGSLETMLNSIWVLSRDLMNVAFALILIGTAVYTTVTAKKDFVASHIKTFLIAIVLINFSWFVPRMIIDVGNVAAAAVFGIPSLIADQNAAQACTFKASAPVPAVTCNADGAGSFDCRCAIVTNAVFFIKDTELALYAPAAGWNCLLGTVMCIKMEDLNVNTVSGFSAVLNGLIVNHGRLLSLATVPPSAGGSDVSALILFLMREALVLVIHIAMLFPLAAMALAFAIRIPVLWMTVAFMPFALLQLVVPDKYTGEYPQKIWSWFLKAAFLPAIVGVPLTIGFILVNAGANVALTPLAGALKSVKINITGDIGNFYELLWIGLSLGVLWVGVFAALQKMEIMGKGSGAIQKFGQNLGGIALKLPLSAPALPGVGGLLSLPKTLERFNAGLTVGGGNIAETWKNAKNPGVLTPSETQKTTERFATNPADLKELNRKLEKLSTEYANVDRRKENIRDINRTYNLQLDERTPDATLRPVLEGLRNRLGANNADVQELNRHLDSVSTQALATPPPPTP